MYKKIMDKIYQEFPKSIVWNSSSSKEDGEEKPIDTLAEKPFVILPGQ